MLDMSQYRIVWQSWDSYVHQPADHSKVVAPTVATLYRSLIAWSNSSKSFFSFLHCEHHYNEEKEINSQANQT